MTSDNDLRHDVEEIRDALKEATERVGALEHKVESAAKRIIYIGACEQKLRDIRDDLNTVKTKLSVMPNAKVDLRCVLLRSLQDELDRPRLSEIEGRYLVPYFECLRRISSTIREDMLNSHDVSEWALRHTLEEFDEMWRRAEEDEKRRSAADTDE
jgi:hypothetical protein